MSLSFKRYIRYVQPRTIMHTFAMTKALLLCSHSHNDNDVSMAAVH